MVGGQGPQQSTAWVERERESEPFWLKPRVVQGRALRKKRASKPVGGSGESLSGGELSKAIRAELRVCLSTQPRAAGPAGGHR